MKLLKRKLHIRNQIRLNFSFVKLPIIVPLRKKVEIFNLVFLTFSFFEKDKYVFAFSKCLLDAAKFRWVLQSIRKITYDEKKYAAN